MLLLFHLSFYIIMYRCLPDSKTISMVSSQLPALTYSTIVNDLKMHYYLFMFVHICAKLINSIQFK